MDLATLDPGEKLPHLPVWAFPAKLPSKDTSTFSKLAKPEPFTVAEAPGTPFPGCRERRGEVAANTRDAVMAAITRKIQVARALRVFMFLSFL
jgi:hypothetical protein